MPLQGRARRGSVGATGSAESSGVEAGEEGAGAGQVALNLSAQGVGTREFLFVAKTMPEPDFQRAGINLL